MSEVITPEKPQQSEAPTSPPETEPNYIELVEPIRAAHEAYIEGMRTTLEKAIEVGRLLTETKDNKMKHGNWEHFVEVYCPFVISTAQNYMRCYREQEYLAKAHSVGFLQRANLSSAIKWLEKKSKKDKDNKDDDKSDDHHGDNEDDNDDDLAVKASALQRAISVMFRLIKELEKDGIEIWARVEVNLVVGRLAKLENKLAEIADCAGIVDAE